MNRKQKIFKAMWRKNAEEILAYVYQNETASFEELVQNFPTTSASSIRKITNLLTYAGLIKSVRNKQSEDKRAKHYIIADETATIAVLEFEI